MDFFLLPGREVIEAEARRFHELASAEPSELAEVPLEMSGAALSSILLAPLGDLLPTRKRLVIVADGALHYVPFSALPLPASDRHGTAAASEPMMARHEVVYIPSASALQLIQHSPSNQEHSHAVAILADPVFHLSDQRLAGRVEPALRQSPPPGEGTRDSLERAARDFDPGTLHRLTNSRLEAETIAGLVPKNESFVGLDFDAAKTTAMGEDIAGARIVHLATHGLLNAVHPRLSGLVLSLVDEQGRPMDGFLRMLEVYDLELKADLVVLSSCLTALGKEVRGEGLVGLTSAFMYAGSNSVVASLWKVDDAATAMLMRHFYEGIFIENLSYASALRRAKRMLAQDARYRSEYYWAAFVLQGEWHKNDGSEPVNDFRTTTPPE